MRPLQLAHPHVAQVEARVVGVEVEPLLEARDAVGELPERGQRPDVGGAGGAVAQRRRAPRTRDHRRTSSCRKKTGWPAVARVTPGPRSERPPSVARRTCSGCQAGLKWASTSKR